MRADGDLALPPWIAVQLPPGYRQAMVDAAGERVHALVWGPQDGPAIVLAHGNPTWSFLWRKVVRTLLAREPKLRIVAPDLVGLGLSSKPEVPAHTLENHAVWFGTAIDKLLGAAPFVLAAQDWGAPISLIAAGERMKRVRGIVLGNTAISPPAPKFKPTLFHRLSQLPIASDVLFRTLGFPLGVLHLSQGDRKTMRGEVARAYRWPLRTSADRAAPLALARMVPDSHHHVSIPALAESHRVFASAQVPAALVWGTRDPILGRVVTHLERLRPDATVTRTRAGHFLQEEVPDDFAAAILDVAHRAGSS